MARAKWFLLFFAALALLLAPVSPSWAAPGDEEIPVDEDTGELAPPDEEPPPADEEGSPADEDAPPAGEETPPEEEPVEEPAEEEPVIDPEECAFTAEDFREGSLRIYFSKSACKESPNTSPGLAAIASPSVGEIAAATGADPDQAAIASTERDGSRIPNGDTTAFGDENYPYDHYNGVVTEPEVAVGIW